MLYDYTVEEEIRSELLRLINRDPHLLNSCSEEANEEKRQLRQQAEQLVAKRQEKDLLDMLYEWRQVRESKKINLSAFAEAFDND